VQGELAGARIGAPFTLTDQDGKPVAICRLKRVAADLRENVSHRVPRGPFPSNGKRVALIGGGPASLTVANDLLPLGYQVVCYEKHDRLGGREQ